MCISVGRHRGLRAPVHGRPLPALPRPCRRVFPSVAAAGLPSGPPGAEGPDDLDDLPWPKAVPGAPPASRPGQGQGQGAHATEAEVAEAIGRDTQFVLEMARARENRILTQPVSITAYKYGLLAQAAAANPSWRQELAAASPSLLNRFLLLGVQRLMRMAYLLHKRIPTFVSMSTITRTTDAKWAAEHPGYEQWLQEQDLSAVPRSSKAVRRRAARDRPPGAGL